jgi:hypothetical protein
VTRLRFVLWGLVFVGWVGAQAAPPKSDAAAVNAAPHAGSPTQPTAAPPLPALPLPPEKVVTFVSDTTAWYRRVLTLQQLPVDSDDVVPSDRLYQTALTALQLSFDFGRAAGALEAKPAAAAATSTGLPPGNAADTQQASPGQAGSLEAAAVRLADRSSALQAQLKTLDDQIAHASSKDKETLTAQRGEVSAALDLTKEIQGTVGQIQRFEETSDSRSSGASGGLAVQIADLQRSIPEARRASASGLHGSGTGSAAGNGSGSGNGAGGASGVGNGGGTGNSNAGGGNGTASGGASAGSASPAASQPPPAPSAPAFRPESAGVIALAGKWFSLEGARGQLSDVTKQTDTLLKELDSVRAAVSQDARTMARQNLTAASTDPAQLAQAKEQFEAAAVRFKQLSTLLIPVGEQGITVESARGLLTEWRNSLTSRKATIARYLALRLGFLLGSIAIVLAISEVWRRATFRYLQDGRRRQQFLALRRVAVGLALTLVILFGLVSEVGSLATYAGLITAGLAVALQNVILAVVA